MATHKEDLTRQWFLDVAACGAVEIRKRGLRMREGLSVFSTDTLEQAKSLRSRHCRLERDGSGTYRLNSPPIDPDDMGDVSDLFRDAYARMENERCEPSSWKAVRQAVKRRGWHLGPR